MALTRIKTDGITDGSILNVDINASAAVALSKLSTSGTASSSTYLRGDGAWSTVPSADSSVGTDFNDNVKARWGTGNDLAIYHDGTNTFIENDTGQLNIDGASGDAIRFLNNGTYQCNIGSTGLNFPDSKKARFGDSEDLQIYHDGSNSYIEEDGAGQIIIRGWSPRIQTGYSPTSGRSTGEDSIVTLPDGAVELYYDNSLKISTLTDGAKTYGRHVIDGDLFLDNGSHAGKDIYWDASEKFMRWEDDVEARFGGGGDLKIYHNGTHSYIENNTGYLVIRAKTGETGIEVEPDGYVQLRYDSSTKFQTSSTGASITGDLYLSNDGEYAWFGASNDLQIGHDGSNSIIQHEGGGNLYINTQGSAEDIIIASQDQLHLRVNNNSHEAVVCVSNGGTLLYHQNNLRFQTTSGGVLASGALESTGLIYSNNNDIKTGGDTGKLMVGAGNDLQIYHDGSNSYIKNGTNDLAIESAGDVVLRTANSENAIKCLDNSGIELYYDNSKKLETNSEGVEITGKLTFDSSVSGRTIRLDDDQKLFIGTDHDLRLYHDGNNSFVNSQGTGHLYIRGDDVKIQDANAGHNMGVFIEDGGVELYHNNIKKFDITSAGATITGDLTINDGTPGVFLVDTNDNNSEGAIQHTSGNLYLKADDNQVMGSSSIRFRIDNAEKARILTNGGITFNGDTSDANALDDYEEGSWTITFVNSSNAAQNSSQHTKGRYVKIGALVYFHFFINFGSGGTVPPNNSTVFKTSLPFSTPAHHANAFSRHVFTVMHQEIKMDDSREQVVGYITHSTNDMHYFECGDDLAWQTLKNQHMNRTSMQMYVSGVMSTV